MLSSKIFFINEDNESTAKVTFAKSFWIRWRAAGKQGVTRESYASRVGRFHGHAIKWDDQGPRDDE
jgi:hypothetical protein